MYAFGLDHPPLARAVAGIALGTDLGRLYRATEVITSQPDGASILDVPCGGGVALRALDPHQAVRYVAADIAPRMLARTAANARRRGLDQVVTREADIAELPFEDGEFDLVVSFTGLHCVPDPAAALAELIRVLSPGGTLAISLWASDVRPTQRVAQFGARLAGLVGPSATEAQLRAWLAAGCEGLRVERSGDFLYLSARRRARA